MIKFVLALILTIGLALWERSFRPFLPGWLEARPLLPFLVLFWMTAGRNQALFLAVLAGLFYDIFSVGFSDLAFLRLPLTVLAVDFFQRQWLTNRSLIASLGLVIIARTLEIFSTWLIQAAAYGFGATPYGWNSEPHLLAMYFWDVIIVSGGFLLMVGLSRRFFSGSTIKV